MPFNGKFISVIRNKYVISIAVFAFIMLVTDHNNLFEQMDRKNELNELQNKKKYYEEEIAKTQKELADLSNNPAAIEKYAREHFQMKRPNEDVFIVQQSLDSLKK